MTDKFKRVVLLHISDIHFDSSRPDSADQDMVVSNLIKTVESRSTGEWMPELVVCTGDLSQAGNDAEYRTARNFVNRLMEVLDLTPRQFFVIPGNHDLDLSCCSDAHQKISQELGFTDYLSMDEYLVNCHSSEFLEKSNRIFNEPFLWERLQDKFSSFCRFLRELGHPLWKNPFCFAEMLQTTQGLNMGMIGLNSAWLSCGKGVGEYGHQLLGVAPMLRAFETVKNKAKERELEIDLNVVMLHHPVEWFYEPERGVVRRIMERKAQLVLQGHQNQPEQQFLASGYDQKTIFLQEGPAYAGSHFPNRVEFIQCVASEMRKTVEVTSIAFDSGSQGWIPDTSTFAAHERQDNHGYFVLWENPAATAPSLKISHWNEFYASCNRFEKGRSYVLVIGDVTKSSTADISALGRVEWELILDFDPDTDESGAFQQIARELQRSRAVHLVTPEQRISYSPDTSTCWVAMNGLRGRPSTLPGDEWREWNRKYSQDLREILSQFQYMSGSRPVTVVVLWHKTDYLRTICEAIDAIFGTRSRFVFATTYKSQVSDICNVLGTTVVPINLPDVCRGIQEMIGSAQSTEEVIEFPSMSGDIVTLDRKDALWLREELDLVHLGLGKSPDPGSNPGRDFYCGHTISWFEVIMHFDVVRDLDSRLQAVLEKDLDQRATSRVNLYHWPGGGGTTLARRVAWNIHQRWPVVLLRRITGNDTVSRFRAIYDLTQMPILVLFEASDVSDASVDRLYSEVCNRPFPVVFFRVIRRFERRLRQSERSMFLDATLSVAEGNRFCDAYSRQVPERKRELHRIAHEGTPGQRSPFVFALTAFENDFISLEDHVKRRLEKASSVQREVLTYIALVYHYAHREVPLQLFASLVGVPDSSVVQLHDVFSEVLLELLVSEPNDNCRPVHELVALEILMQSLAGNSRDKRIWRQNLSRWAKDFAVLCSKIDGRPNADMQDILRRLFIVKEVDAPGIDLAQKQRYVELIENIPSTDGKVDVVKTLTELFPKEAHFWAHYGRVLMMEKGEFRDALTAVNRAVEISENDFVLYHMKGMIIGRMAILRMNECKESRKYSKERMSEVKQLVEDAADQFSRSRWLAPESEHAYISHIDLLLRTVDFGFAMSGVLSRPDWLSSADSEWYRDLLDTSAELLDDLGKMTEGEEPSMYFAKCVGRLYEQYGDTDQALRNWDVLLRRRDIYQPPIRRQIVNTYLARTRGSWKELSSEAVTRIFELMEDNLREEPGNERNIRLWFEAARRGDQVSREVAIERLTYWRLNSKSIQAVLYLYILHILDALDGSALALQKARDCIALCMQEARARGLRIRTNSIEWLGKEAGLRRIVNGKELETWSQEFEEGTQLELIEGRIAYIDSPVSGKIELPCGLLVFFVPSPTRGYRGRTYHKGQDENQRVKLYMAFTYDGPQAWSVRDAET